MIIFIKKLLVKYWKKLMNFCMLKTMKKVINK